MYSHTISYTITLFLVTKFHAYVHTIRLLLVKYAGLELVMKAREIGCITLYL